MAIAGFVTDSKAYSPIRNAQSAATTGAVTSGGGNYVIPINTNQGYSAFAVGNWVRVSDGTNTIIGVVSAVSSNSISVTVATATVTGTATSVATGAAVQQIGQAATAVNLNQIINYSLSGNSIVFRTADGGVTWNYATAAAAAAALALINTNIGATALE